MERIIKLVGKKGYTWGILWVLALIWGSSFILMKKGLMAFSPVEVGAIRLVSAGLVLLPITLRYIRKLPFEKLKYMILIGITGSGIPAFLFPLAETRISSGSAGILNALSPIFTFLIAWLFFQHKVSLVRILGIGIGFIGAVCTIMAGGGEIDFMDHILYSGMIVFACALYGLTTNLVKTFLNEESSITITAVALTTISFPYIIYLIIYPPLEAFTSSPQIAWASIGYLLILGIIGTAFAVILFNQLVQITDPIFASSVTYVIPLIALMWGVLDQEKVYIGQGVGMIIILLGVYLANKSA